MAEQAKNRRISRRDFLKLLTAGATGSFLAGCAGPPGPDEAVPYYQDPPAGAAGKSVWYNTVCRMCPAGCGIRVRTVEGRAKKIEGNPDHPISQGRLCALGQAGLQHLYNPDRITRPFRRAGSKIQPIGWDEAVSTLADAIRKANARGRGRVAIWTGPVRGTRSIAVGLFANAARARWVAFSPFAPAAERAAHQPFRLGPSLPTYDLSSADLVVCLGADFLERWLSPVYYGAAYGRFRQGRDNARGYLVHVSPRLSMTAANADEWIPCRPGAEGALALAVAHILLRDGLARHPEAVVEHMLHQYTPAWAARTSDVPERQILRIARLISRARSPLVLAGGCAAAHTNGTQNVLAALLLNQMMGQPALRDTAHSPQHPVLETSQGPREAPLHTVQTLLADMRSGRIDLLIVLDANPAFELPASMDFAGAAENTRLIVSLSSFPDETAAMADLVLPDHTYLERWGIDVPDPQPQVRTFTIQQPVVQPLYDTRPAEGLLGRIAQTLWDSKPDAVEQPIAWNYDEQLTRNAIYRAARFQPEMFWSQAAARGGLWSEPAPPAAPARAVSPLWTQPRFQPAEGLHLLPCPTIAFWDGSGANLAWMQELPDPMISVVWDSWAEMHPRTAQRLGIEDGEIAVISSPAGEMRVGIVLHEGLHPDVIAVPVGQGHTAFGCYAADRGANPLALLAPLADQDSGALAWAATKVKVKGTGERADLVRMADRPRPLPGNEVIRIAKGPKPL